MMQSDHNTTTTLTPDEKITQDLTTLSTQITLCQSMLTQHPTPSSIDTNESLLAVIGFLEACVPRMLELIEAAASGALGESVFEECLVLNDKLTNILGDVEKDAKDRMPLTSAASVPVVSEPEIDLNDTMEGMNLKSEESSGENDPFSGMDLLTPTPPESDPFSGDLKPAAVASEGGGKVEEEDDFDAFFKDRTSAPSATGGSKED